MSSLAASASSSFQALSLVSAASASSASAVSGYSKYTRRYAAIALGLVVRVLGRRTEPREHHVRRGELARQEPFVDAHRRGEVEPRLHRLGLAQRRVLREVAVDAAGGERREQRLGLVVTLERPQRAAGVETRIVGKGRGRQRRLTEQRQRRVGLVLVLQQVDALDEVGERWCERRRPRRRVPDGTQVGGHRGVTVGSSRVPAGDSVDPPATVCAIGAVAGRAHTASNVTAPTTADGPFIQRPPGLPPPGARR